MKTALKFALGLFVFVSLIGLADAIGTYTIYYNKISNITDNLYLDFVSSVSNATVTFNYTGFGNFDNSRGGVWKEAFSFPITTVPTTWANYKIVINGTTWELYNVTGALEASGTNSDFWNLVNSTGADIRVFNQSGAQLYFWIEEWDYANQTAIIWVNLTAGSTELNIAYGNPSALPSAYNKLTQVFNVSTDFEQTFDVFTPFGTAYEFNSTIVKSGQYSLRTYDAGENVGGNYTFTIPSDKIIITEWVYITGKTLAHLFTFKNSAGNWIGPHVTIGVTGSLTSATQIYYYSGGWVATGVYLTNNTWYKLTIVIDIPSQTWDLYLNDNLVLTGKPFIANMPAGTTATFQFDLNGATTSTVSDVYFDAIYIPKLADPANFGTPKILSLTSPTLELNGYVISYSGELNTSNPSVTLPINSTYFTTLNTLKIYSDSFTLMNVTISFDYEFSASVTIHDYYNYISRECKIDTGTLITSANFSQVFPLRTADFQADVVSNPSVTYTVNNTGSVIIVTATLQPGTSYDLIFECGYLIANITAKDELTQNAITSFNISVESWQGYTSKSTTSGFIKIYGNYIKLPNQKVLMYYSASGYAQRSILLDQTKLNQNITVWLLSDTEAAQITFTVVSGINVLPDAQITVEKLIGANYVVVAQALTDQAGSVSIPLKLYDTYKVTVEKAGYQTIVLTLQINQLQYTIQLGGGVLTPKPLSALAFVNWIIYPLGNTLVKGNTTFTLKINPNGKTLSEVGLALYENGTLKVTKTATSVNSPTELGITYYVNKSANITLVAWFIYNGQTYRTQKVYVCPPAVGLWAAFVALNDQLAQTPNGNLIGTIIASMVTLAVVCSLAYYTTISGRGLGFVALVVFTMIGAPLGVPIYLLALVWLLAIALMWYWR